MSTGNTWWPAKKSRLSALVVVIGLLLAFPGMAARAGVVTNETIRFGPDSYDLGASSFDCVGWGDLRIEDERGVIHVTETERNGEIQISETIHFEGRLVFDPYDESLPTYTAKFAQMLAFQGRPDGAFGGTVVANTVAKGSDGSHISAHFVAYFQHNAIHVEPVDYAFLVCNGSKTPVDG